VLGGGSQQLGELSNLVGTSKEHPVLVDVEGPQPRKRGPIVRPAETPSGIDSAQRLGKRGTRFPGHIGVLDVRQQWMGQIGLGPYRKQPAAPRLGDRNLGRAPRRCQRGRGDQADHRVGPSQPLV